jgi:hypothetical protein
MVVQALMAQATEQGGSHVLVAEEVQPVIVVEVKGATTRSRKLGGRSAAACYKVLRAAMRTATHGHRLLAWGILASIAAWTSQAHAGWIIDWAVKGVPGVFEQVSLQANRMKIVTFQNSAPVLALIVDLDAANLIQVYFDRRHYIAESVDDYVLTRRAASKMGRGLWPAHAPIDEVVNALKRASPAERMRMEEGLRRYEQQVAPRWGQPEPTCPPARLEVSKSDQEDTISGYRAVRHDVVTSVNPSEVMSLELWIASGLGAWRELDPRKLQTLLSSIAQVSLPCRPLGDPVESLVSYQISAMATWRLMSEGYPMRKVWRRPSAQVMEVVKVETRPLAATEFEPPPGFARKTFGEHIQ